MKKNRIQKVKVKKLFNKYLTVITSVILMSVFIVCTTYIVIATRYWNSEQISTLEHNSTIIAKNSQEFLENYYTSGKKLGDKSDITPLAVICNTMRIMSDAISADIFITDMDGDVVVCKETLDNGFNLKAAPRA